MSELPPPGWYADPTDPRVERRWDGTAWQDETRPRPPAPLPTAPGFSARRVLVGTLLGVILFVVGYYLLSPIADGFHFGGCTPGIDHERVIRLGIQYCR